MRTTQIYIEAPPPYLVTFEVMQGAQRLAPGHNRQAALDSGITM